jgi:hypothetical protein
MITYTKKDLSKLYNIGDALCTPDVYFDIQSNHDYTIIGGGVWNIAEYNKKPTAKTSIVWAAGKSDKDFHRIQKIRSDYKFLEWGIRDLDLLEDKTRFLPCVSCFNTKIISEPKGDKTLVFTNANEVVSSEINKKLSENYILAKNNESEQDFLDKWEQCDKVITNSYHGIYWSLLSGRKIIPFGYSSKFISATHLFGIEFPRENLYNIKNRLALSHMIDSTKVTFMSTKINRLETFRELNLAFAENLKSKGIICKLK